MYVMEKCFCRDSVVVATINCATSFFGGFVIFSVLGFMSIKTGVPVKNVATDGLHSVFSFVHFCCSHLFIYAS